MFNCGDQAQEVRLMYKILEIHMLHTYIHTNVAM